MSIVVSFFLEYLELCDEVAVGGEVYPRDAGGFGVGGWSVFPCVFNASMWSVGSGDCIVGRPLIHVQYIVYHEHFLRFNEPPE